MPERNGQSDPPPSDLDDLGAKLDAARAKRDGGERKDAETDNSLLGMAWRLSTELLVAVFVGWLLGYGVDVLAGTRPWGALVGLGLGIAAGFYGVFRTAAAMDAKTADVPLGDAMPQQPDELDD